MLVEGSDGLLVPILEDVEAAPIETVNGVALVGDHQIHQHQVGGSVENRVTRGWLRIRLRLRAAAGTRQAGKNDKSEWSD
jgi:hypothetical protein